MSTTSAGDACAIPPTTDAASCALPAAVEPGRTWTGPSQPQRFGLLRRAGPIALRGGAGNPGRGSLFLAPFLPSRTASVVFPG